MKKRILTTLLALVMIAGLVACFAISTSAAGTKVAKIGTEEYESLSAAIADAASGDTITLLADVTENVDISKNLTIDGAYYTYTGKMTLKSKANVTIRNINFDGKSANTYAVEGRGAYYITIENCTAKNYTYGFLQVAKSSVSVTLKNVAASGMNYGAKIDYASEVTLENVDLDCAVAALMNSNFGAKTLTIKNSKLNVLYTWTRNNTTKTTYLFEGANTVGAFNINADLDTLKLADVAATLKAPAGYNVTTDVADKDVVFAVDTYSVGIPGTKYRVAHELWNIAGDKRVQRISIYNYKGVSGTLTEAKPVTAATDNRVLGYTAQEIEQQVIAADGSTLVIVKYVPSNNTKFKVQHLLMNKAGDKVYKAYATYTHTGTTTATTNVSPISIPGYIAREVEQKKIAADGSTMVKIYYDPCKHETATRVSNTIYPTCTEDGELETFKCDSCGLICYAINGGYVEITETNKHKIVIPATGHNFVDGFCANGCGEALEFTITFIVNDEVYATITQDCGTAITAPADPTKVGYIFAGWDKEIPATMPAEDVTITATWIKLPGSGSGNVTNELFTIQCTEVEEHSWLVNWFGSHVTYVKDSIKWNEELGRWEAQAKIGTSMLNNINLSTTKKNYFGGFTHYYDVKSYTFDLYYDPDFTGLNSQKKEVTGMWLPQEDYVCEVYCHTEPAEANLSKISATVMWVRDADAAYKNQTYSKKYAFNKLIDGTYTVGEMYEDGGKFYMDVTITDLTPYIEALEAQNGKEYHLPEWKNHYNSADDFKIILEYTGSTTDYKQDGTGWAVSAKTWANNTEKYNGKFLWVVSKATVTYTDGLADVEVFADQSFTVDVVVENGGKANNWNDFSYSATPAIDTPVLEGHTFSGWTPEWSEVVKEDVDYVATWDANEYTITFVVDGETYATITQDYGTAITAPADPTKVGYTFAGWDVEVPATMPAGDMTITATWDINVYNITIVPSEYGTVVAKVNGEEATTACYGDKVVFEVTTNEGHTFIKLNYYFSLDTGSGAGGAMTTDLSVTMKNGDLRITPVFDVNEYTITFISDGETYATITQDYGTAITAPADPAKTGYTFGGWDKEIPATMPAEDMTITAKWTANSYTITFISDGAVYKTITQDYGTAITAPADPTKTGYTFGGWDKAIPATMPAENVTITAKWTANKYTVKFDGTGNGVYATMKDQYFTYDVPQALNENEFIRDGYRFLGWATKEGGEVIFGDGEEVMNLATSGEITLYPVWELNIGVLDIKAVLVYVKSADHGEVTMNRKMVPYNTYAYMTITPDDGYEVDTITAVTRHGYEVKVYDNGDGTYKMKMPLAQVNVTVTFKQIAEETPAE